jgi:hypothetical protein
VKVSASTEPVFATNDTEAVSERQSDSEASRSLRPCFHFLLP